MQYITNEKELDVHITDAFHSDILTEALTKDEVPDEPQNSGGRIGILIGIIVAIVAVIAGVVVLIVWLRKRRNNKIEELPLLE